MDGHQIPYKVGKVFFLSGVRYFCNPHISQRSYDRFHKIKGKRMQAFCRWMSPNSGAEIPEGTFTSCTCMILSWAAFMFVARSNLPL
jgi:hypothetical protein